MKAVQYREIGKPSKSSKSMTWSPRLGGMVVGCPGLGLCHSDEFVMSLSTRRRSRPRAAELPMTWVHETAGEIVELGEGTGGVEVGDRVLIYGCWGCGVRDICACGNENYCRRGMVSPASLARVAWPSTWSTRCST